MKEIVPGTARALGQNCAETCVISMNMPFVDDRDIMCARAMEPNQTQKMQMTVLELIQAART